MRCEVCDKTLSETEVSYNNDCQQWEYCTTCLIAIAEIFEDHMTDEEVSFALDEEWGDFLSEENVNDQ